MSDPKEPADEPSIIGGSFTEIGRMVEDAIRPSAIHHQVDDLRAGGELLQYYNYIVYEFERDGIVCRARAYLDTVDEVALLGQLSGSGDHCKIPKSAFRDDVLRYFKRRFRRITELGEEGYLTIWTRSN